MSLCVEPCDELVYSRIRPGLLAHGHVPGILHGSDQDKAVTEDGYDNEIKVNIGFIIIS